jgi:hypothetical protein
LSCEFDFSYFFALHNVTPLEVWCEDFIVQPRNCIAGVAAFSGCLEIANIAAVDINNLRMKRQRSDVNDSMCEAMRTAFRYQN